MSAALFSLRLCAVIIAALIVTATSSSLTEALLQINITVDTAFVISGPTRSDFASYSVEVPCAPVMIIDSATKRPRQSYLNLMSFLGNLSRSQPPHQQQQQNGASINNNNNKNNNKNTASVVSSSSSSSWYGFGSNLRIGGNSADESYFVGGGGSGSPSSPHSPLPPGDRNAVTDKDIDAYSIGVNGWDGSVVIDLNLRNATDPSNSVAYLQQCLGKIPHERVLCEIGNECDLFPGNGIRPKSYSYQDYARDFKTYVDALKAAGVSMPIVQGATFATRRWDADLLQYLEQFGSTLKTLSHHFYPMSSKSATIEKLMADGAVDLSGFGVLAALYDARGTDFVLGEMNSAYDGGAPGVSDAFASSIWGADVLFNALATGVKRANFHGCARSTYSPIQTSVAPYATASPLYYGMWFFTHATRGGAQLVETTPTYSSEHDLGGVRFWSMTTTAFSDDHHHHGRPQVRLVGIHKNPNPDAENATVTYTLKKRWDDDMKQRQHPFSARVYRLSIPDHPPGAAPLDLLKQKSGIYFAGQTFDGSELGLPLGKVVYDIVPVSESGERGDLTLTVTISPATAFVVELDF